MAILFFNLCRAELLFIKEDLHFSLDRENFYVEGDYYLQNSGDQPISKNIFYPFPENENYGEVTEVTITIDNTEQPLTRKDNGVAFLMEIPAHTTKNFYAKYIHPYQGNQVEYILTTTNNWHRALQEAEYSLEFPKYLQMENISYQPDSLEDLADKYIFYWSKQDFLPKKNFIVEFKII